MAIRRLDIVLYVDACYLLTRAMTLSIIHPISVHHIFHSGEESPADAFRLAVGLASIRRSLFDKIVGAVWPGDRKSVV